MNTPTRVTHDHASAEQLDTIPTSQLSTIAGGVIPRDGGSSSPSDHGSPFSPPHVPTVIPACPNPRGVDPGFTGRGVPGPDPDPYFSKGGGLPIGERHLRGA